MAVNSSKGPGYATPTAGGSQSASAIKAWGDEENSRLQANNPVLAGKPVYGTAGQVSRPNVTAEAGQVGQPMAANPVDTASFSAFQQKHPGYVQVYGANMGETAGGKTSVDYVADPSKVIYDPEYGLIAPANVVGKAGPKSNGWFKEGGWGVLLPVTAALAGGIMGGVEGAISGSEGAATLAGGAGSDAIVGGSGAGFAGATAEPLIGAGSLIPDYTAGILSNAGNFGAGVVGDGAAAGAAASGASGGFGVTDLFKSPTGIINQAQKWMQDNPIATMVASRALTTAFTPNAIDLQDNAAKNQMGQEQYQNAVKASNTQVNGVRVGIMPSGAPLRDLNGNLIYPRKV